MGSHDWITCSHFCGHFRRSNQTFQSSRRTENFNCWTSIGIDCSLGPQHRRKDKQSNFFIHCVQSGLSCRNERNCGPDRQLWDLSVPRLRHSVIKPAGDHRARHKPHSKCLSTSRKHNYRSELMQRFQKNLRHLDQSLHSDHIPQLYVPVPPESLVLYTWGRVSLHHFGRISSPVFDQKTHEIV